MASLHTTAPDSSHTLSSYSSPTSLTADLDTPENQRARIALFANREYVARSINAIRQRYPTSASLPQLDLVGADEGYKGHIAHLFTANSPLNQEDDVDPRSLPNLQNGEKPHTWPPLEKKPVLFHVGIIGAGMAGLYTAMILKSLNISYEVLEASHRIGGRVYTPRFSNNPGDYYDAGAMRFPDNPIMARTFHLFNRLGIQRNPGPPNTQLQQQLIRYHLTGDANPSYYNNILVVPPAPFVEDPFHASIANGGTVPDKFVASGTGTGSALTIALGVWRQRWLKNPFDTWVALKNEKDGKAVSTRQEILDYIHKHDSGLSDEDCLQVANWYETRMGSTCAYDQSMIETFIHSMDFNYPISAPALDPDAAGAGSWWCMNGGTDVVARRMVAQLLPVPENIPVDGIPWDQKIPNNIILGRRVTSISCNPVNNPDRPMQVHCEGVRLMSQYSHVITTTTSPCLQVMDLRGAGLSYAQKESIRVLRYNPAVKLGIKFSTKWWIANGIIRGGQGKTDRPTRTVVYPSYALNDPVDGPGVLLASYNASMDAARLGGHAAGGDPKKQQRILDIVLHDLAEMHNIPYGTLQGWVVSHHFHDWSHDGITCGGWGEFGPGQFTALFTPMQQPAAGGRLFFAGELTSIYHGWIVAALKSAYRSVYQMLWLTGQGGLLNEMVDIWGMDPEAAADPNMTDWLIALGFLAVPLGL